MTQPHFPGSTLDKQPRGSLCTIQKIHGSSGLLERLISMGLTTGTRIKIILNTRAQPLLLYARDTLIALARKEAGKIKIKKVEY